MQLNNACKCLGRFFAPPGICTVIISSSYNFRFCFFCVLCFVKVKLSVKVKLFVSLLCVCAILPGKAIPKMTYTVSGRTLNPAHSLSHPSFLQGFTYVHWYSF